MLLLLPFLFRGRDEDCFVFLFFPFSLVLSSPKEVSHQALFRSALLNGPDTSKRYSPSPHGGPSLGCAKSLRAASVVTNPAVDQPASVLGLWARGAFLDKNGEECEILPHGACLSLCTSLCTLVLCVHISPHFPKDCSAVSMGKHCQWLRQGFRIKTRSPLSWDVQDTVRMRPAWPLFITFSFPNIQKQSVF